jgi:hypothetical protein
MKQLIAVTLFTLMAGIFLWGGYTMGRRLPDRPGSVIEIRCSDDIEISYGPRGDKFETPAPALTYSGDLSWRTGYDSLQFKIYVIKKK